MRKQPNTNASMYICRANIYEQSTYRAPAQEVSSNANASSRIMNHEVEFDGARSIFKGKDEAKAEVKVVARSREEGASQHDITLLQRCASLQQEL